MQLKLGSAVDALEGVHVDVLTGIARISIERDEPAAHRRDRDPRAAGDDAIATAEHAEPKTLTAIDHRPRPDALLRELATDDERGVAVVRRRVRDAERAGRELAEHGSAQVDHHDTFTALDGQRAGRRLPSRGGRNRNDEREDRAEDDDELPHRPALVSACRVGAR